MDLSNGIGKSLFFEEENSFCFLVGVVCISTVKLGQFRVKNNITHGFIEERIKSYWSWHMW